MAKRPTITEVTAGYTSQDTLNTNLTNIQVNFDNFLSLDGSTPNAMNADLDMNSNDIINVKDLAITGEFTIDGQTLAELALELNSLVTVDEFVGDGSTTAFTLSVQPVSESNVMVAIDGVRQHTAAFSISGSTITFTEAPTLNSAIIVSSFSIADIGTAAATNITISNDDAGDVQAFVEEVREDVFPYVRQDYIPNVSRIVTPAHLSNIPALSLLGNPSNEEGVVIPTPVAGIISILGLKLLRTNDEWSIEIPTDNETIIIKGGRTSVAASAGSGTVEFDYPFPTTRMNAPIMVPHSESEPIIALPYDPYTTGGATEADGFAFDIWEWNAGTQLWTTVTTETFISWIAVGY